MATRIKETIIETFKLDRESVEKLTAKLKELSTRATSGASS